MAKQTKIELSIHTELQTAWAAASGATVSSADKGAELRGAMRHGITTIGATPTVNMLQEIAQTDAKAFIVGNPRPDNKAADYKPWENRFKNHISNPLRAVNLELDDQKVAFHLSAKMGKENTGDVTVEPYAAAPEKSKAEKAAAAIRRCGATAHEYDVINVAFMAKFPSGRPVAVAPVTVATVAAPVDAEMFAKFQAFLKATA